jgi:large conductance mechanosensitive channel
MALLEDFKKFAFKGNVIDLAVGVVIGAAFGKIVAALVADFIMPFVALAMPSGDWRKGGFVLRAAADPKDSVILQYGDFLGAVLDFLIVAFVLFFIVSKVIKAAESRFKKPSDGPPAVKECTFCLESIPFKATRCKACTSQLA